MVTVLFLARSEGYVPFLHPIGQLDPFEGRGVPRSLASKECTLNGELFPLCSELPHWTTGRGCIHGYISLTLFKPMGSTHAEGSKVVKSDIPSIILTVNRVLRQNTLILSPH